jgi:glutaredoxin/glutathione-dependent peroxiredoxin
MLKYVSRVSNISRISTSIRLASFKAQDQPRIRIGSIAPNFKAVTTEGEIDFHEFIGDSWTVLFSHPADFTPVCTTELGAFAKLKDEFVKRNTKLIGLSADPLDSHKDWVKDIEETQTNGAKFNFPIIADHDRNVAFLYDMVDEEGFKNINKGIALTIRNVFIIDPKKKVRLFLVYPASTGRNTSEVLRVLDSLQLTDRTSLATPVNWQDGQDVIVPTSVKTEDAQSKFGSVNVVKPYLRYVKQPEKSSMIPLDILFEKSSESSVMYKLLALGLVGAAFGFQVSNDDSVIQDLKNVIEK